MAFLERPELEGGNEKWRSLERMPWPKDYGRADLPKSATPLEDATMTRAKPIARGTPLNAE